MILALVFCNDVIGQTNDLRNLIDFKKGEFKKYYNDLKVKERIQYEYDESTLTIKSETKLLEYRTKYLNKLNLEILKLPRALDLDKIKKDIMLKLYEKDLVEVAAKIAKHKETIENCKKHMAVLDAVWTEMFTKTDKAAL
jgi:hypothetical protein